MIKFSDSLSTSILDDEVVVMDMISGKYFGLNAVGSRMFTLLKENLSIETTLETLSKEYTVEKGQLKSDLLALLKNLKTKGLLDTDEV